MLNKKLELDPFDQMLAEANEDTAVTSNNSRVLTHVILEIIGDICPNYCFRTSRQTVMLRPCTLWARSLSARSMTTPDRAPMVISYCARMMGWGTVPQGASEFVGRG